MPYIRLALAVVVVLAIAEVAPTFINMLLVLILAGLVLGQPQLVASVINIIAGAEVTTNQ